MGFPFPEDTTLILCGFLIARNTVRPVPAILVVYAGLLIADFFLYTVGRKYGRKIVSHRRFRKILSEERLSMVEARFRERGILVILFGRHLIGLRAQLFLAAGTMRMSALKFILADAVSALVTMSVMIGAGFAGGYGLSTLQSGIVRVRHFSALAIAVVAAAYLFYRFLRPTDKKTIRHLVDTDPKT